MPKIKQVEELKDIPVPESLHTELKVWCALNQTTIQRATARALAMFLATNGRDA